MINNNEKTVKKQVELLNQKSNSSSNMYSIHQNKKKDIKRLSQ